MAGLSPLLGVGQWCGWSGGHSAANWGWHYSPGAATIRKKRERPWSESWWWWSWRWWAFPPPPSQQSHTHYDKQGRSILRIMWDFGISILFFLFWLHHALQDPSFLTKGLNPGPGSERPTHNLWTAMEFLSLALTTSISTFYLCISVIVLSLGCNFCKGRKFYCSQHLVNPQYIFVKCLNKTSSAYFVISFRNCDAQLFFCHFHFLLTAIWEELLHQMTAGREVLTWVTTLGLAL